MCSSHPTWPTMPRAPGGDQGSGHRDPHPASEGPSAAGRGMAKASISRVSSSSSYCNADVLELAGTGAVGVVQLGPCEALPSQPAVCASGLWQPTVFQEQLPRFPPLQRVALGGLKAGGPGNPPDTEQMWHRLQGHPRELGRWRGGLRVPSRESTWGHVLRHQLRGCASTPRPAAASAGPPGPT